MGTLRQDKRQDLYVPSPSNVGGRRTVVGPVLCVACGGTIADVLSRLGSTRCHDCRDGVRPAVQAGSGRVNGNGNGNGRAGHSPAWSFLLRVRARQRRSARSAGGETQPRS